MSRKPIDPILAKWRKLLRRGALTVRRAVQFSGIGRTELFALMRDGALPWFKRGQNRLIPRAALVEYLAALAAGYERETGAGAQAT